MTRQRRSKKQGNENLITNEKLEIDIAQIIEIIDKNNPELLNEIINQSS